MRVARYEKHHKVFAFLFLRSGQAAVDYDHLPGDGTSRRSGEEGDRAGDFLDRRQAMHRDAFEHRIHVSLVRSGSGARRRLRVEPPRRDGVDRDAVLGPFDRQHARHLEKGGLADAVDRALGLTDQRCRRSDGNDPARCLAREEMAAERARPLAEKRGLEIAQGLFLSYVLASPRCGSHLVWAMLRPSDEALERIDDFRATGVVDLGGTYLERRGNAAHLEIRNDRYLNAEDCDTLPTTEVAVDLALLDPLLAAEGRRIHGNLVLDAAIAGSLAVPRVTGSGKLTGGELQDYARGVRIQDFTAAMQAGGTRIRFTNFSGRAGPGTLSGSGNIDLAQPGMPIDMTLDAKDARPITSDLITASFSGQLRLTGQVKNQMTLSGKVDVPNGEINLPRNFPPEVASLNVRRRGQPPAPPPPKQSRIVLDVDVRVSGRIFVRGQGVDADMGGSIHVGGVSTDPVIAGEFTMNRGNYSLAGQTLDFTTGKVRFDGVGVRGRLDPTLDFLAQTVSAGVTANLAIGGYASAPKITLSSTPQLPQDEVIAHLLFQQSVKQLTPLQLASIAQAVASIGGVGGGFNPLGVVRRNLGLDRLAVGSVNTGVPGSQSQTTVEAGRYVMRNVYVGLKQNLSGGTQTQVQVDITRRLKAQATVATGTSAPTVQGNSLQSNDSSIGLSYQFEY